MPEPYQVLLIANAARGYDRRILSGVGHYARLSGSWLFRNLDPMEVGLIRDLVRRWRPRGIISCTKKWDARLLKLFQSKQIPVVQAGWLDEPSDVPQVWTDPKEVVSLVAEYFIMRGVRSLGYVGGISTLDRQSAESMKRLADHAGCTFNSFFGETRGELDPKKRFDTWLKKLPRPAGLLAGSDWIGWNLINACVVAGFRVPDDFAVVGIDDDRPWCELTSVPLSSVALAAEKIGYRAAGILHQQMMGGMLSVNRMSLPPVGIIARRSTDMIAAEDPEIGQVLRYIHDHAGEGVTVKQALHAIPMDRRKLERWFRQNLGRSPLHEIRRLRVARVKTLLAETDEPMDEIARRCGFSSAKLLSAIFLTETGTTMLEHRRQFRRSTLPVTVLDLPADPRG